MQSAPIPFVRQNLAGAAALLVVCTGIWVFYLLLQAVIYQGGIFRSGHAAIYMLNSFSCMLVALALGYFTGMISENAVALNGINNVLSLGSVFPGRCICSAGDARKWNCEHCSIPADVLVFQN